jgi:hypothetical protein
VSDTLFFDVNLALRQADWRRRVGWPTSLADTHKYNRAAWKAFWPIVRSRAPQEQDVLLLAGARIIWQCLALGEAASVVQSAAERGLEIVGAPAAVNYLMNASDMDLPPIELAPTPFKNIKQTSFSGLRRFARSAALSAPAGWPRMMIAPDAVALSYNSVMHNYARKRGLAIKFTHADDIFIKARKRPPAQAVEDWIEDVAPVLVTALLGGRQLSTPYRERFARLANSVITRQLSEAANGCAALRQLRVLPDNIWCGGQLSARYLAIEARRRGATVTGFEHGWGLACEEAAELTAYAELAMVDQFVAMTPTSAERLKASAAHRIASPTRPITFIAGDGDGEAKRLRLDRKMRNGSGRPTVVYAPTVITGFRQFLPPILPDVVHLDWQFRICEELTALPVNFICRPHPEGLFRGRRHPLNAILRPSESTFEELMDVADVFVFDFQQSTTFGRALCSDRGIVLIDLGTPAFDERTETELRKRCHVIRARYDELNRPHLDKDELREAVFAAGNRPVDTRYFRDLMLGD